MESFEQISVCCIGSGNVAYHLMRGLHRAGVNVAAIVSRNAATGSELARLCEAEYVPQGQHIPKTDVVIVSIPDDFIADMIGAIDSTVNAKTIICHTSGTTPMVARSGATGVWYPLQTFSREKNLDLYDIPFLIEADSDHTRDVLSYLASRLSNDVRYMDSQQRKHIHVAAVSSCNFINHLLWSAFDYLDRHDIPSDVLRPLMKETFGKFMLKYPADTQTGPAKRDDDKTIDRHLTMLKDEDNLRAIYEVLTQQIEKKYENNI